MQRLTILCVGKLQETWWRDAAAEYEKRLKRYCDLKITELPDEKAPVISDCQQCEQYLSVCFPRIIRKTL